MQARHGQVSHASAARQRPAQAGGQVTFGQSKPQVTEQAQERPQSTGPWQPPIPHWTSQAPTPQVIFCSQWLPQSTLHAADAEQSIGPLQPPPSAQSTTSGPLPPTIAPSQPPVPQRTWQGPLPQSTGPLQPAAAEHCTSQLVAREQSTPGQPPTGQVMLQAQPTGQTQGAVLQWSAQTPPWQPPHTAGHAGGAPGSPVTPWSPPGATTRPSALPP